MAIVQILIGILFAAAGVALLLKQMKNKKNNTASAQAEVVNYDEQFSTDSDNNDTVTYYPIMRYSVAGHTYEKKYDTGSGKKKYAIGAQVDILYDPNQPENFMIAGDNRNYIVSVIFIIAGIAVFVSAFLA